MSPVERFHLIFVLLRYLNMLLALVVPGAVVVFVTISPPLLFLEEGDPLLRDAARNFGILEDCPGLDDGDVAAPGAPARPLLSNILRNSGISIQLPPEAGRRRLPQFSATCVCCFV